MCSTFYVWQQRWATKKVLLVLSLLFLIFPLYLLPQILPEGRPLDLHLYYSAIQALNLMESYGAENRAAYLTGLMTIDIIYPLFYTLFLSLLLSYFSFGNAAYNSTDKQTDDGTNTHRQTHNSHSKHAYQQMVINTNNVVWEYGLLCSLLFSDILENIAIVVMLKQYPEIDEFVAVLASSFTSIKWLLFGVIFVLLLYRIATSYLHHRKATTAPNE